MLTSRRLLNGPNRRASSEDGSALGGNVGGERRSDVLGFFPVGRVYGDRSNALSSGPYTGGREHSTDGMIRGGAGVAGWESKGYESLVGSHMDTDAK